MVDVLAHVPGTVSKIEKQVGDVVARGDVLVVLECMKMQMQVEAPVPGWVAEVRCYEGQATSEGDVLMVLG